MPKFPPINLTEHWQSVYDSIRRIIDLVPEDKWDWTPREGLWNSRGIAIHIADCRDSWLSFTVKDGEPYPNIWSTVRSTDDLRREHARAWARLQRFLASQEALDAEYEDDWDGKKVMLSGHWIAFHIFEHDVHHRAELLQRLALLGVEHDIDF
jgi:uncharacterized damage-inducible protein DinB